MGKLRDWIVRLDARHRVAFSLALAAIVSLLARPPLRFWTASIIAWDVFAVIILALTWPVILLTPVHDLRRRAREQDVIGTLLFVFAVAAARCSLIPVFFPLHNLKADPQHALADLPVALFAVLCAWSLIHTVF